MRPFLTNSHVLLNCGQGFIETLLAAELEYNT
jgi:hypothetical protein